MKGRKNGRKMIVICLSALLVAGAFLLPSGLFALQDQARAQQSTIGVREKVSLENLAENYEQSLHNRMSILAERLGDERNAVYVSESEVTMTEDEKVEFLAKLRENEMFYLYARGFLYVDLYAMKEIRDDVWKCYVIYDTQGILLVCYYIELWGDKEGALQLLVDAEDGTVYYEQGIYHEQRTPEGREYAMYDGNVAKVGSSLYTWIEGLKYKEDDFWDIFFNLLTYYEVDYLEESGYKEQYNYDKEMNNQMVTFSQDFGIYLGEKYAITGFGTEDDWWMWAELVYGGGRLIWEISDGSKRVYGDGGRAEFFQGFPALAELIPEYQDYEIYEEPKDELGGVF